MWFMKSPFIRGRWLRGSAALTNRRRITARASSSYTRRCCCWQMMKKYFQNQSLAKLPDAHVIGPDHIFRWVFISFFVFVHCIAMPKQVLCASRVTSPVIVEPTFSPNVIYCSPQQCAATVTWHFHNFTWPRANKFRPNLGEAGRTHRGVGVLQIIVMKKNFIFCVFC